MVMVLPGSPLPFNSMVLSAVAPSPFTPVSLPIEMIEGVPGATVSMLICTALEGSVTGLPAVSTPRATMSFMPSARAAVVKEKLPSASAVTVPATTPLMTIATNWPGVAVPVMVSVLSAVSLSPTTPVSVPTLVITGPAGSLLSSVNEAGPLVASLPAVSVAEALKLWVPSVSGSVVML